MINIDFAIFSYEYNLLLSTDKPSIFLVLHSTWIACSLSASCLKFVPNYLKMKSKGLKIDDFRFVPVKILFKNG